MYMSRKNRTKYTAYLLGLISVCSGFSKINVMESRTSENISEKIKNPEEKIRWNLKNCHCQCGCPNRVN